MSLYRHPHSKIWWYEFQFAGQRIRESTKTHSKKLAGEAERTRHQQLEASYNGVKRRRGPKLFAVASREYLEKKRKREATLTIAKRAVRYLLPQFGRLLVTDIGPADIHAYQQKRLDEGFAPRTVDIEVGALRAILGREGVWSEMQRLYPRPAATATSWPEQDRTCALTGRGKSPARRMSEESCALALPDRGTRLEHGDAQIRDPLLAMETG